MPVDPTISLDGQQYQAPNPLAQLGQVIPLINQANQNQLFQQQNQARQAIGQAYQQATNPLTGELDTNRLSALVANDPRAAFMAGDVAKQSLERQQQQLQLLQQNYKFNMDRLNGLQSRISSLLQMPGTITKDMVKQHATDWMEEMNSDPEHPTVPASLIATLLGKLPSNPDQIRPALKLALANTLSAKERLDAMMPTPTPMDMGDRTEFVSNPQLGSPASVGTIRPGYSPGQGATPVPGVNTDRSSPNYGAPTQTPLREAFPLNPPTGVQPPGGGSTRFPGAFTAPQQPNATPSQTRQSGLSPSESLDIEVPAKASNEAYARLQAGVNGSATRIYQLQQATRALDALPPGSTGVGADTINHMQSFLQTLDPGVLKNFGIVDPEKIKNFEELKKYTTQYAQQQAAGFGHETDRQLATSLSGNPSSQISTLGNKDLLRSAIALERMQQAQLQAFEDSGKPPSEYNKWSAQWNRNADPRVYAFDQMTPAERQRVVDNMTPKQQQQFALQLRSAMQAGFLNPPQSENGQ